MSPFAFQMPGFLQGLRRPPQNNGSPGEYFGCTNEEFLKTGHLPEEIPLHTQETSLSGNDHPALPVQAGTLPLSSWELFKQLMIS
jgi:hypothetical protein